ERREEGLLGLASGWLTRDAAIGAEIALTALPHRNFQLGANAARPLILIGNGTGIAGLRAHLRARADAGPTRNWLVFGERQRAHDFHFRDDIEAWQASGLLERVDLAFSRDQAEKDYVQHRLLAQAPRVREWLDAGAAIYLCGSLDGMAAGVEQALAEIAGCAGLDALIDSGRYRRDVY
ncbi:MAG: oxidoreductase, partial [Betaproteobacteria bacterium]